MIRLISCFLLVAGLAQAQQPTSQAVGAVLRGLDKVSGRTSDLKMPIGASARMGRLTVTLTDCRYPAGNPAGDAFAGLQIREEGAEDPLFSGWMIASAPALSALDHARYDLWVIRCTTS